MSDEIQQDLQRLTPSPHSTGDSVMESTHSRAKWYVIAFHYQMAALLIVVSAILILNAIFSPGIVVPPLIVPKW
ncbi:MAG TPA: hypothetical protein VLA12_19690, partial [Planctomycetaceae bacterium]|nr:hypothetical protein [Planctomycetaceae bacterium]